MKTTYELIKRYEAEIFRLKQKIIAEQLACEHVSTDVIELIDAGMELRCRCCNKQWVEWYD